MLTADFVSHTHFCVPQSEITVYLKTSPVALNTSAFTLSLFFIFYFKQVSEPHQLKLKHNLKVLLIVVPVLCRSRRHRQKERKMHLDCG